MLRQVIDEDTGIQHRVLDVCYLCDKKDNEDTWNNLWIFNKRSGLIHFAGFDEGYTLCGKDATGTNWLWQS